VSNPGDRPARAKAGTTHRPPRRVSVTEPSSTADAQADSDASPTAADESGNRALHAVAAGPNPNVDRGDREDIERPTRERGDGGSIEST
jgi:hypothetical protein